MAEMRGMQRIRLSEWATREGVARITAYRMLRRGILPAPTERSPTGRWYVYVPTTTGKGIAALYAYAERGKSQSRIINEQMEELTVWAGENRVFDFTSVREIGNPRTSHRPKLARLLADPHVSEIVVTDSAVIGSARFALLAAALTPQRRAIVTVDQARGLSRHRRREAEERFNELLRDLWGARRAAEIRERILAEYRAA